jgi:uncharacterized protein YbjT (DUF2867 family)
VGELLKAGYRVRCLVRNPAKVTDAPWADQVEILRGDVAADLAEAMADVAAVYYLVHTIGDSPDWVARDRQAAERVRDQAAAANVERIVYLGGLGDSRGGRLSPHLASRHEVGRTLADGPVSVTELRAAAIIGSGSASFEMLRYVVEVLPVMVTPKWVRTRCQPIAVRDVLRYLVGVLGVAETSGRILEVGGVDVLSYHEMMNQYAAVAGLRPRRVLPVPLLTPRASSYWVGLVTPLPPSLARPLVDSLVNEVVVGDDSIERLLPGPLFSYREAVAAALAPMADGEVATSWASAELRGRVPAQWLPTDPDWAGGTMLIDSRQRHVDARPDAVFAACTSVGGARGWYAGEWLWTIRGWIDKLVGGVGMRRQRRDPNRLSVGDPVDFWRVDALEPCTLVRLRAEMRLPGDGWLEWRIEPDGNGSRLEQRAWFRPRGLWGRAYWLAMIPFHRFIFPGLIDGLARSAEERERP